MEAGLDLPYRWHPMVQPIMPPGADEDDEDEQEAGVLEFAPEDVARAGAIVTVQSGKVHIRRGLLKEEPKAGADGEGAAKPKPDFSAAQVEELTRHQTAALRLALVREPMMAKIVLAHALATPLVRWGYRNEPCIEVRAAHNSVTGRDFPNPEEAPAHAELEQLVETWRERLPDEPSKLWGWLLEQDEATLDELITVSTALSAYAVVKKHETPKAHVRQVQAALGLDMANYWTPSEKGFVSRMSKAQMTRAMGEAGCNADEIARMQGMKKDAAAQVAAKALAEARWVPAMLKAEVAA